MKKAIALLCLAVVCGCEVQSGSTVPQGLVSASTPADDGTYVIDNAGALGDVSGLETELSQLNTAGIAQLKVLVVPSLNGEDIEGFAQRVAHKWALGTAKKDNGILVVLAPNDRKVRVQVGYGLEGTLTDQYCGEVSRAAAKKYFKSKNYLGGTTEIVHQLVSRLK